MGMSVPLKKNVQEKKKEEMVYCVVIKVYHLFACQDIWYANVLIALYFMLKEILCASKKAKHINIKAYK